jgi:hypothetical protein
MKSRALFSVLTLLLAQSMAHCALGQSSSSAIPAEEAHFTQEQLKEYYLVYENSDVRYLRTLFDAYLSGAPGRDEEFKALSQWAKDYYRSKFIVLSRDPGTFGGTFITIMFQDHPDKAFVAWVYKEGEKQEFALRRIELAELSKEDIRRMQIRYRAFLMDKIHAM